MRRDIAAAPLRAAPSGLARLASVARAVTAYPTDDRAAIGLLLLPFMVVAMSLGLNQTLRPATRWLPTITDRSAIAQAAARRPAPVARLPEHPAVPTPALAYPPAQPALATLALERPAPLPIVVEPPGRPLAYPTSPPFIEIAAAPSSPPQIEIELPGTIAALPLPLPALEPHEPVIEVPVTVAALPLPRPAIESPSLGDGQSCRPTGPLVASRARRQLVSSLAAAPDDFGAALAAAAKAQTSQFVIYTARYWRIAYPMGDFAAMHGACTDVVIRAYRALGIDLQELVQRANVGGGDPSIDHRRTETLRRFFALNGAAVDISAYGEDYKPGDIVTYYRPFSRVSRSHIAIVSDVIAASGRPMIIHNRGYGPQLEDALFVDRITGHYRYEGPARGRDVHAVPRVRDAGGAVAVTRASYLVPKRRPADVALKAK